MDMEKCPLRPQNPSGRIVFRTDSTSEKSRSVTKSTISAQLRLASTRRILRLLLKPKISGEHLSVAGEYAAACGKRIVNGGTHLAEIIYMSPHSTAASVALALNVDAKPCGVGGQMRAIAENTVVQIEVTNDC